MQWPWRSAAYWLAPHGLLSLLSDRTQDHLPRVCPTHNGRGPPPISHDYKSCPTGLFLMELSQARNLEAGADAEAMEGAAYWLASPASLSLLSYRTQDYQPRDGTTHKGTSPLDH